MTARAAEPGFSATAWDAVQPWYVAITRHPFLTGLARGTLAEPVFIRYLLDDAHYLLGYSAALAALAARCGDVGARILLSRSAVGAVEAERSLHRTFLLPRGVDPDADDVPEPTPTCSAYVDGLRATATMESPAVGMAAILPCFRVYAEIGAWVMRLGATVVGHPYRAWIEAYADPVFAEAVRAAEACTDRFAERADEPERAAMLAAYRRSSRWEWMFFDAAWRGERWPDA